MSLYSKTLFETHIPGKNMEAPGRMRMSLLGEIADSFQKLYGIRVAKPPKLVLWWTNEQLVPFLG